MNKTKEISVNYTVTSKLLSDEGIRYSYEVYSGQIRRTFRFEGFNELVTLRGYGLNVIISEQGKPTTTYNFGYLTGEAFELAYLVQALAGTQLQNFDHLRRAVRSEAATWGELVFDVEGKPVYDDDSRIQKRDPFVKAVRRAAERIMSAKKRFAALRDQSNMGGCNKK